LDVLYSKRGHITLDVYNQTQYIEAKTWDAFETASIELPFISSALRFSLYQLFTPKLLCLISAPTLLQVLNKSIQIVYQAVNDIEHTFSRASICRYSVLHKPLSPITIYVRKFSSINRHCILSFRVLIDFSISTMLAASVPNNSHGGLLSYLVSSNLRKYNMLCLFSFSH
jgi:hypothetical protein